MSVDPGTIFIGIFGILTNFAFFTIIATGFSEYTTVKKLPWWARIALVAALPIPWAYVFGILGAIAIGLIYYIAHLAYRILRYGGLN